MKRIYLEPVWKLHSLYNTLISDPPEGYEFIAAKNLDTKTSKAVSNSDFSYILLNKVLDKLVPSVLLKSWLQKMQKVPSGISLTYGAMHMVLRNEPWVCDLEYVSLLVGYDIKHFKKHKKLIQDTLSSTNCKKIICWSQAGLRTLIENLDCSRFDDKLEVIPFAVRKRDFVKIWDNSKVKLLFVNSGNIPLQFHYKGGKEVLEAFSILSKKYDNIEMIMRSDMPPEFKARCHGIKNITVLDKVIPWEELEYHFKSADIFLYPTHSSQDMAVFDAMSFELPVIITDVFANAEVVENDKTGFVINPSQHVPYYVENHILAGGTPEFEKAIRITDSKVVQDLVARTSIIIENPERRREMGKAGRWEIEDGKFSIKKRNDSLKRILDEATY